MHQQSNIGCVGLIQSCWFILDISGGVLKVNKAAENILAALSVMGPSMFSYEYSRFEQPPRVPLNGLAHNEWTHTYENPNKLTRRLMVSFCDGFHYWCLPDVSVASVTCMNVNCTPCVLGCHWCYDGIIKYKLMRSQTYPREVLNTLEMRKNGHRFAGEIFTCVFTN